MPRTTRKSSTRQSAAKGKRRSSYVEKVSKKDTVKHMKDLLYNVVDERFTKLYGLWSDLGFDGLTKRERTKAIKEHFEEYLDGMVEEEFVARNKLLDSLEIHIKKASKLCKELGIKYEEPDGSLSLMQYEEAVGNSVRRLSDIKEDRIREANELVQLEEILCAKPSRDPVYESLSSVPSKEQLEGLRECVRKLEAEVEKVNLMKDMKEEMKELWENCFYSEEQRNAFEAFHSTEFTEELFALHEVELTRLKDYFSDNKKVLTKLGKWHHVWKQSVELERRSKDPSRLTNIRENILLQQERERNKVKKILPRLERELTNLISDWEQQHHDTFLVDGVSFTKFLEQQRQGQEAKLAEEKQVRDETKRNLQPQKNSAVADKTKSTSRVGPPVSSVHSPIGHIGSRLSKGVGLRLGKKISLGLNRRSFAIKKDAKVRATPARAAKLKTTYAHQAKGLRQALFLNKQNKSNAVVSEVVAPGTKVSTFKKGTDLLCAEFHNLILNPAKKCSKSK